jgi:hypothetical protein
MAKQLFLSSDIHLVAEHVVKKSALSQVSNLKSVFITTASEPKSQAEDLSWQDDNRTGLN